MREGALCNKGKYSHATQMIQRLIKSNSTNPNYHHLYANILYNMGDCDGRCRESKLALDLNPDNVYYETNRYQCI